MNRPLFIAGRLALVSVGFACFLPSAPLAAPDNGGAPGTSVGIEERPGVLPPTVVSAIPDTALDLGGVPLVVDLATVFDDPDGDALVYGCSSDAPGAASVGDCSGGTLTVTAESAGTATVTVTATDPGGESATDAFVVTVVNPPPVVESPISNVSIPLGGTPFVIELSTVFVDPNGDTLSFACSSNNGSVASVGDCAGGSLTVTAVAVGTATITVTAADALNPGVSTAFVATVVAGNAAPTVVSAIPDTALDLGGVPLVVDLGTVFDDPDGDALVYGCSSDAPGAASVGDCSGGTLTVTAEGAGTATVTVTATDPGGESATDAFVVTVVDNLPPVVVEAPGDATLVLEEAPLMVDLTTVFADPEGDTLSFACSSNNGSVASVGDCAGGSLTVTAVAVGTATITVTAADALNPGVSTAFVATVVAGNAAPTVVSAIPDTALDLGGVPLVVDLATVFDDPDGDALIYACSSDAPGAASVGDCSGGTLTVTAESAGTATVTVTATDPGGESATDAFVVTVVNPPPVVENPISNVSIPLGGTPFVIELSAVFVDPNSDTLSFACSSNNGSVASVGDCSGGTLTATAVSVGTAQITVTASDGANNATDVFVATVVNPPPVVARPIPDFPLLLGGDPYAVDLDTVFVDPNGDALGFSFGVDASAVQLTLDGSVLLVAPNALGQATVTVTASDGAGSTSDVFGVTVVDNLPPVVVDAPGNATLVLEEAPLVVDLTAVFTDPEGDALVYGCVSSVPGVASVGDCSGGSLTVTAVSVGAATITVSASDGRTNVDVDLIVTVVDDDLPPVVVNPIIDITLPLAGVPFATSLLDVFEDPEGATLSFTCASSAPGVASVGDCSGGILTVTAVAVGTAQITVTASDGANNATDVFVATVVNPPPVVARPIPDFPLLLGGDPYAVDLDTVFVDPNGDALGFSFGVDASAVQLTLDGSVLLVAPNALGQATVTVTASDGAGSTSDVFGVTVVDNLPPVVVDAPGNATLVLEEAPLVVDLTAVFTDPEGDALVYGCVSSVPGVASVGDCSGGSLTVTAVSVGAATITVSASDGRTNVDVDFIVTVVVGNRPPSVTNAIADVLLGLEEPPLEIGLTTVFDDPDGDELGYTCFSDAPGVASVGDCSGGVLSVTAMSEGMAMVTVTAADPDGEEVADEFIVTVVANAPPVVTGMIANMTLTLDAAPLVVDLDTVFVDPDEDPLTFGCSSDAPGVVSVEGCAEGLLTVTAVAEGETVVTVTASDGVNPVVGTTFVVTVVNDNAPPTVVSPIPDAALTVAGPPLVVDLAEVFDDPNGDVLVYACQSSASGVASVGDCAEGMLTVTPGSQGVTTVTVTASDPDGAMVDDALVVTVGCEPASIGSVSPSPPAPDRGSEVTVTATVGGSDDVALRYRVGSVVPFGTVAMARVGDTFAATIPGDSVTVQGVEFYVEAQSACSAPAQSPLFALRVHVPSGVTSPALPAATGQTGFRLVSVPIVLDVDGAADVLDVFGPAADEAWRLFELLPPGIIGDLLAAGTDGQWYRDDPSAISLVPGRAFWLIVRNGGPFTTGAGTTLSSDDPFSVELQSGWNLIGTPFGHDVPLDRVRLESGAPLQLQAYEGSWRNETSEMLPFQGYALRADAADRLIVEPSGVGRPSGDDPSRSAGVDGTGDADQQESGWSVRITAELGRARDDNNVALASPSGAEGRDPLDWYEPPPIGEYVSVSFDPSAGTSAPLTVDARPIATDGVSWPFRVRSSVQGRIALTFDELDEVPADFVVWLVDEAAATVHDLRREPAYAVASQGTGVPARMRLVIGTEAYARATSGFDGTTPQDYDLAPNYPNPFATNTTIPFALPRPEHVVVEVFDIVGRRVATLIDEEVEAGYHHVVWDGRASGGHAPLASGVYIYRLRAGSFTATGRMVRVH